MKKLLLIILLTWYASLVYSQQDQLLLKKRDQTIASYSIGSYIAFKATDFLWYSGLITRIHNDSLYLKPMIVHYTMMGIDTTFYNVVPFSFADIAEMPKKGVILHYTGDGFQINRGGGHIHFYWVKSGWIFRAGATGYIALNLINNLIKKEPPFAEKNRTRLAIAAAVFAIGEALHLTYRITWSMGKKYHLQTLNISERNK